MTVARPHLLWFGEAPSDDVWIACVERDLILSPAQPLPSDAQFSAGRGIVFAVPSDMDGITFGAAHGNILRRALWHGLGIFILGDISQIASLDSYLKSLPYGREPRLWARSRMARVAEEVARWNAGPSWSGTLAVQGDDDMSEEDRILLRRAFADCSSITLTREPDGRSADVFRAYARLRDSRVGPLPLPFFVKLDRHPKIAREIQNYRDCTTLFVPFNQRPNLDLSRCTLGAQRGLIVGNFVEESETLRDLADRGTAGPAIHSLFHSALRSWRNQAHHEVSNTVERPLVNGLSQFLPSALRLHQRDRLQQNFRGASAIGATHTPDHLERVLRALPACRHRCALMHGDLHGQNVRVHHGQAILIDFASTAAGPLVADPAALDVALIMGARSIPDRNWEEFTQKAYRLGALTVVPAPAEPTAHEAALWDSVRQIRQIALADQLSEYEYATAVAVHLLRRAAFRPDRSESERRRHIAYLRAEQLISELGAAACAAVPRQKAS